MDSGLINTIAIVLQIMSALGVILLVLLQHGKGADMGAAFGSGASGSLFGATGSANFLSRLTAAMAAVFFISTLALAFLAHDVRPSGSGSLMEGVTAPPSSVPAVPGSTPSGSALPPATSVPSSGTGAAGAAGSGAAESGAGAAGQIPK